MDSISSAPTSRRLTLVLTLALTVTLSQAGLAVTRPAGAASFSFADGTNLGDCGFSEQRECRPDGFDGFLELHAEPNTTFPVKVSLQTEIFRGVNALGINTLDRPDCVMDSLEDCDLLGEVDHEEFIRLTFAASTAVISSIEFSRLFGPNSGDAGFESVVVTTVIAGPRWVLTVDPGEGSASWTLPDGSSRPAVTISKSLISDGVAGAGWYRVNDPFGGVAIENLFLNPGPNTDGLTNDFAFVALATVTVPEPATGLLLAAGLVCLLVVGWIHRST